MQVFDQLAKDLPYNELGLPKFLYRADLIPEDLFALTEKERSAILNSAVIPVTYREGYPTLHDGTPIWDQLDTEEEGDFGLFQIYIGLDAKHGYRQLAAMPEEIGSRIPSLRPANRDEEKDWLRRLTEMASIHFWLARAKAYDLFKVAMARKTRERRMMDIEDFHFIEADNILRKILEQVSEVFSAEKLREMSPNEFVKAFKDLQTIMHTALGVSTSGGRGKQDDNAMAPGASVEVALRQVARISGAVDQGGKQTSNTDIMKLLLGDESAVVAAQELIFRVNMSGRQDETTFVAEQSSKGDEAADLAMIHGEEKDK